MPSDPIADVWGKGSYPLRSVMTQLDYLTDAPFESNRKDAGMAVFIEAASIIRGCDVMEEFLACAIWLLSEGCEFEVERKDTPLSKDVVPIVTSWLKV
jgi:hypothetical protein